MSRRDTILIAVLINTGLLAILFLMAVNIDEDRVTNSIDVQHAFVEKEKPKAEPEVKPIEIVAEPEVMRDEIDQVLKQLEGPVVKAEPVAVPVTEPVKPKNETLTITVKRGDSLGKIALQNGTTISKLMEINHLTGERIDVGQVLKVPASGKNKEQTIVKEEPEFKNPSQEYYVVQSGDNPWTIAKKFHVRFDELLKLNNLDESKARRLRAGDKLRVR